MSSDDDEPFIPPQPPPLLLSELLLLLPLPPADADEPIASEFDVDGKSLLLLLAPPLPAPPELVAELPELDCPLSGVASFGGVGGKLKRCGLECDAPLP